MAQNGGQSRRASWWSWLVVAVAIVAIIAWAMVRTGGSVREGSLSVAVEQEHTLSGPLSMESDGDRLMPLLVPGDFRSGLAPGADPPYAAVESLGLEIVYVLDAEQSVRYLTKADLDQLGITRDELHERAMENLRKTLSREAVRSAFGGRELISIKNLDSYDATRLLLVPEYLEPEEELGAAIPDRDTLILAEVSEDSHWRMFEELAQVPASDRILLRQSVKVTHEGFELR